MLAELETRLIAALAGVLPSAVKLVAGPFAGPAAAGEAVAVHAAALSIPQPAGEDRGAWRGPAELEALHSFAADGAAVTFAIPDAVAGDVAEVESPAGHPARSGEAYVLEGRVLRFFEPPPAGSQVVVTLRGAPAEGFVERRPAEVGLLVSAWADSAARADDILERSLGALFPALLDLGTIGARRLGTSPTALRLHAPQAFLDGIERALRPVGDRSAVNALARLSIHGELELAVVRAASRPARKIGEIQYTGRVLPPR